MRSPGYIAGPLVIPGVVQVTLRWGLAGGKRGSNVLHADNPTPVDINPALAESLFTTILADARWTGWAAHLSDQATFEGVSVRDISVALAPQFDSASAAAAGTSAANAGPDEVALCITLKGAIAGRSGRGRVYLPALASDNTDAQGHAVLGVPADGVAFVQAVEDALATHGLLLTIATRAHAAYASPSTGLEVPALPASSHGVVSILSEDNVFDSQRRRK